MGHAPANPFMGKDFLFKAFLRQGLCREIAAERNPVPATQRIRHDAEHPSALILPVIGEGLARVKGD